jgi:DeoR family glycerol-3-phosphate regulon repressor
VSQTFRHPDILEIARKDGKGTGEGLADHFGVTVQTIRRDLTEMANAGKLERVHGGAVLPSGVSNIIYEERRLLNEDSKRAIAQTCAQSLPNDAAIFMNIGTSTEAVARELLDHQNLMVVTNNINVAQILSANKSCQVIVTGGSLRPTDGGLIGNLTVRTLDNFKFDYAVLGCSAIDEDGDILDFDPQEVIVSQAALGRSRKTLVVADETKLRRHAPIRIFSLSAIDGLFTDAPLPDALAEKCAGWNTQVHVPSKL